MTTGFRDSRKNRLNATANRNTMAKVDTTSYEKYTKQRRERLTQHNTNLLGGKKF
jgi:hypothetical protein